MNKYVYPVYFTDEDVPLINTVTATSLADAYSKVSYKFDLENICYNFEDLLTETKDSCFMIGELVDIDEL